MTEAARASGRRGRTNRDARDDAHPSPLVELADYMGIVAEYLDQTGHEVRVTSDATRRALLSALGVDASTDDGARESLAALRDRDRRRLIPPVRVVEYSEVSTARL